MQVKSSRKTLVATLVLIKSNLILVIQLDTEEGLLNILIYLYHL